MMGGDLHVFLRPARQLRPLVGRQRTHDLGRGTHDERTGRHLRALGNERVGSDNRTRADDGAVQDGGMHTDEALVADGAGVDHREVADRDAGADLGR